VAESSVLPVNPSRQEGVNLANALHILTIGVRVGEQQKAIGYVTRIERTHARTNTHLKQLEPFPNGTFASGLDSNFGGDVFEKYPKSMYFPGETVEVAPGILEDETVRIARYVLYTSTLFEAFVRANMGQEVNDTSVRLVSLLQQVKPVELFEFWLSPYDGKILYGIHYQECWFRNMGHTVETGRDAVISEDAELDVTRTRPFLG